MCRPARLTCSDRLTTLGHMSEFATQAGRKLLAVVILLVAAYVLFKVVLGFITGLVWIVIVVAAVIAIVWATRIL